MPYVNRRADERARQRRRLELGLCVECSDEAVPGRYRCQKHLDGDAARAKKARERKKEADDEMRR